MNYYFDLKILLQSVSVLLSLSMIVFFLVKGKKTPLLYSYIFCQIAIFIWSSGQIMVLFSIDDKTKWFSVLVEYTAIVTIGFCWLVFCLFFTYSRLLGKRYFIVLLSLPSALTYTMLATNNLHGLFFSKFSVAEVNYGPLFWVHAAISYTYLISGTAILIKYYTSHMGTARKQARLLISAVFIPFVANILYLVNSAFDLSIVSTDVDITPLSFAFSMLLFAVAVFRFRFLNIVPIAFRKIIHNLNESIVVIDSINRIDNFNKSFVATFPGADKIKSYDNISRFIKILIDNIIITPETEKLMYSIKHETQKNVNGELTLLRPEKKSYHVNIQPLFGNNNEFLGKIILFSNITEYKRLLDELNEKNIELSALNAQLAEYATKVEELAIIKERNRFARDVHDTLGHTMTLLISLLEVSSIMCRKEPEKASEKLGDALKTARDGLKELRRSIKGLEPENLEYDDIVSSIKKMTEDFKLSGMEIDFVHEGLSSLINAEYSKVIFRVCQEALTNSLRHGKAKHVSIILKISQEKVKLFIFDDGCGCANIKKGFGLSGMEQRAKNLNGKLILGSDGESGFNIRLEIPLPINEDSN
ncbi:MAG: hypothetical protein GX660_11025 [Clostridiaceae bacterium]|nr:hypothetical protein [Clostridiaceae bacterium]